MVSMFDDYRVLGVTSFVIGLLLVLFIFYPSSEKETSEVQNQELGKMEPMPVVYGHYFTKGNWSSAEGWTHVQTQKHQGRVVNDTYKLDPGKLNSYFAVKFKGGNEFNQSSVEMKIPEPGASEAEFVVATSTEQDKKIDAVADPCECIVYRGILHEGVNNINLKNVTWKNYTYFKVDLERKSAEVESLVLASMEVN